MNEAIEGMKEVRKNLNVFERRLLDNLVNALEHVAFVVETYIKVTYQRPISGKGFTDRTGALRRSITHRVVIERGMIIVWIFAGMEYGPHVEHVVAGKYAFMLPGFLDKKMEILPLIILEMKKRGIIIAA